MNKKLKTYIIFGLPILIKYIFLFIFVGIYYFNFKDLIEDLLFFIIILILFYNNTLNNRFLANSLIVVYIFNYILEGTSYLAVSSNFTSSYMYVLIESNQAELKEFIGSYQNIKIISFLVLLILSFFLLKNIKLRKYATNRFFISVGIVFAIIVLLKFTGLIESNAYHNVLRGTYGYFDLQRNFQLNTLIAKEDVQVIKDNDVLVVVFGESTTRNHMELYGYGRKTNPYLTSCKDSLYVYNDVISTDIITTKSVPKMLTSLSNGDYSEIETSIIDVFKIAGYKTYWLSNQRPIGYYDNRISEIASRSDYLKFFNHIDEVTTLSYDEVLLPKFSEILSENGKKVIFLSLIGTHFDYDKRYPKGFEKFNKLNASNREEIINHYDNAIYYNDYIVFSFLKDLRKSHGKNAFIYLSDHGENVYDHGDFFGRTESNLTKGMFDIPFVVWTSESFELPEDFEYKHDREFMADNLYESIGHLFGIKHKDMDFTKSIFSATFQKRKRIVVNGLNYDEYFFQKDE